MQINNLNVFVMLCGYHFYRSSICTYSPPSRHSYQVLLGPLSLDFLSFFRFFPLLRSLFFKASIPARHTSAYRTKNPSRSPGSTTVAIFTLSLLCSFDFPSVTRNSTGSVEAGERSENCGAPLGVL